MVARANRLGRARASPRHRQLRRHSDTGESILFGHEKGSFTGATERHTGKFVEAHSGTLFLDEIGDLPPDVQVKLLRAVQDGEVDPVGGRATVRVDIRLISATHRDLLQLVKDGVFREDLFYRLNVFPIFVPPLRERKEDIPYLVRRFMDRFAPAGPHRRIQGISGAALAMLCAYDWPGNIRQLENAVFRASVLAEGEVLTVEEFPQIRAQVEGTVDLTQAMPEAGPPAAPVEAAGVEAAPAPVLSQPRPGLLEALDERGNVRSLAAVELEMIKLAIDHYNGQMSEVARRLRASAAPPLPEAQGIRNRPRSGPPRSPRFLSAAQAPRQFGAINQRFTTSRTAHFGRDIAML